MTGDSEIMGAAWKAEMLTIPIEGAIQCLKGAHAAHSAIANDLAVGIINLHGGVVGLACDACACAYVNFSSDLGPTGASNLSGSSVARLHAGSLACASQSSCCAEAKYRPMIVKVGSRIWHSFGFSG